MPEFENLSNREKQLIREDRIKVAMHSLPPGLPQMLAVAATMVRHAIELGSSKDPKNAVWVALETALTDNGL